MCGICCWLKIMIQEFSIQISTRKFYNQFSYIFRNTLCLSGIATYSWKVKSISFGLHAIAVTAFSNKYIEKNIPFFIKTGESKQSKILVKHKNCHDRAKFTINEINWKRFRYKVMPTLLLPSPGIEGNTWLGIRQSQNFKCTLWNYCQTTSV